MWTPDPDADEPRWRAELWLVRTLVGDRVTRAPSWGAEPALELATAAGALDAATAQAWRARLDDPDEVADLGPRPPGWFEALHGEAPDGAPGGAPTISREHAQQLLEELLVMGGLRSPGAAVRMLERAGAIDPAAADRWERAVDRLANGGEHAAYDAAVAARAEPTLTRLLEALGPDTGVEPQIHFSTACSMAGAIGALDEPRWREAAAERRRPPDGAPQTFYQLVNEVGTTAGPSDVRAGLEVTEIVHYDVDSVCVRWRAMRDDPGPSRRAWHELGAAAELQLADDLGTDYGPGQGHVENAERDGERLRVRGKTRFRAAVPPAAHELRLTWGGGTSTCDPWP